MPFPALLLILAALLPLAGCATLLVLGRRLGSPLAGYVATFFVMLSFLCSGWGMIRWIAGGNYHGASYGKLAAPIDLSWRWLPSGAAQHGYAGVTDFSIYIDSLTVGLFVTITLTAMLVHIFAARSMRREPRFVRFFIALLLSCFSALAVILCGSLLYLVAFLELTGLGAALVVAFRGNREMAARGAARFFLVNRIGDAGLLVGMGILFSHTASLDLTDLWASLAGAAHGALSSGSGSAFPTGLLTVAGAALFLGAAARCAQFPLHIWAGDVAEGAATAAASVFALTLSVAGIYTIARLFPIFTPSARLLLVIVGATTLTVAALIACAQSGIKQVLCWTSASQLGLIVLAVGIGSWVGALFHLIAYMLFQVLLFLGAGSVIRAAQGETDLARFGGLVRKMPVTAVTCAAAILAAFGVGWHGIGLSGYYSRVMVMRDAGAFAALAGTAGHSIVYWAVFELPIAATGIVAFALVRWWMLTFAGPARDRRVFEHARDATTLYWPLVLLAIMIALAGRWLGVSDMFESAVVEVRQLMSVRIDGGIAADQMFQAAWTSNDPDDDSSSETSDISAPVVLSVARTRGQELVGRWLWLANLLGITAALLVYARGPRLAGRLVRIPPIRWIHAWLASRMYFDELYDVLLVRPVLGMAFTVAWIDRHLTIGKAAVGSRSSMCGRRLEKPTARDDLLPRAQLWHSRPRP